MKWAKVWLFMTALFGSGFVGFQCFEFTHFVHLGLTLHTDLFGSTFFTLTGFRGPHVTGGVIWLLSLWVLALRGKLGPQDSLKVEICGLYWHFVDIVCTVSYGYDNANRRTSMTVLGQVQVTYGYDNADRLTSITQGTASVTIGYDDANRRTSGTLPNTVQATYGYDTSNRLTSITFKKGGTTLGTLTYTYDAAGRRTVLGGTWARTGLPQVVASASYNANNQQTAWGSQTNTFDLNGNLTSDGTNAYTWDARDRLASISGGATASFAYDPTGRRASKTISGTTTQFLYDGANPVQEFSGAGAVLANLLTGLSIDEYFTRTDGSGRRTLLADALRSILSLADDAGALQTSYTYEPFGNTTVSGQANGNSFQYTGRENDQNGAYYYRARYYNPAQHRLISEDPVRLASGDVNAYAYVHDSPINLSDPSGLEASTCGGMIMRLPAMGPRSARKDRSSSDWLPGARSMASPDLVILVSSGSQGRPDLPDSLKKHQCLQDCERDVRWEFLKDLGVTGLVAGGCGVLALAITSANPIAGRLPSLYVSESQHGRSTTPSSNFRPVWTSVKSNASS
jgi:RHS repeat-associated protein